MQIPSKNSNPLKSCLLILSGLALFGSLCAQEASPTPSASKESEGNNTEVSSGGKRADDATATSFDYFFNRKAKDGSGARDVQTIGNAIADKLKALDSMNNKSMDPLTRARFEKFLATAEIPAKTVEDYKKRFAQTQELLRQKKPFDAWKLLYLMAENNQMDAGISRELANRVESIWDSDKTNTRLSMNNEVLKQDVERTSRNSDLIAESVREQFRQEAVREARLGGKTQVGGSVTNPSSDSGTNSQDSAQQGQNQAANTNIKIPNVGTPSGPDGRMVLAGEYLKNLESRARIRINELKMGENLSKSKADFAEYISTLFNTRRYLHVVTAADFYRRIYLEGDYPVSMAQQVNASLETMRDVSNAVEVYKHQMGKKEVSSATSRLAEAFVTGEFHPEMLGIERSLKDQSAAYLSKLGNMANLIEARDFANLEVTLKELKELAVDFDIAKPLSLVNSIKLESQLRLGKARLLAQQGQLSQAIEEFQVAAEAWPGNPDLATAANTFFSSQDFVKQSQTDLDRLFEDGNFRSIFDKQMAIAPTIKGDARREEMFRKAMETVTKAEAASAKAAQLMMNGDVFGAWETAELAAKDWPEDTKLNKLRADLAGKGAEFISAINKAKEAESRREWGYSLSWYVNAQRHYPASQMANEAIERLSKSILEGATL